MGFFYNYGKQFHTNHSFLIGALTQSSTHSLYFLKYTMFLINKDNAMKKKKANLLMQGVSKRNLQFQIFIQQQLFLVLLIHINTHNRMEINL